MALAKYGERGSNGSRSSTRDRRVVRKASARKARRSVANAVKRGFMQE